MQWPVFQINGRARAANLYVVPGIQAPGLVNHDGTILCCITNKRVPVGLGIGTLFEGSFLSLDNTYAVSAAAMCMGQQAIRQHVLEQLIEETLHAHHALLQALAALKSDDLDRYISLAHDAESLASLLSIRTSWLTGIIAIMGGEADPMLRRLSKTTLVDRDEQRQQGC
jgi:hypothetical protein